MLRWIGFLITGIICVVIGNIVFSTLTAWWYTKQAQDAAKD